MERTLDLHQTEVTSHTVRASIPQWTVLATLRQLPMFSLLNEELVLKVAGQCQQVLLQRGDVLFTSGDKAFGVYAVCHGWVKMARETLDGSEAVLDVLNDGHTVGESVLLNPEGTYNATATAVEETTLVSIPLALLNQLLKTEPNFAMGLLKTYAQRQRMRDMELENRALKNAPQRIGCFLLRLCPITQQRGEIVLHLPYDKTLLAAQLGMQPETFSRALARLKTDLQMEIKGATVTLPDVAALRGYACSGCSGAYPCEDLRVA